jgi:hypothetical protein
MRKAGDVADAARLGASLAERCGNHHAGSDPGESGNVDSRKSRAPQQSGDYCKQVAAA